MDSIQFENWSLSQIKEYLKKNGYTKDLKNSNWRKADYIYLTKKCEKENKNYVVYVKKLFFLKNGIKKISVSRYKYKTLLGARRRCKLMNSRQDVVECYIN